MVSVGAKSGAQRWAPFCLLLGACRTLNRSDKFPVLVGDREINNCFKGPSCTKPQGKDRKIQANEDGQSANNDIECGTTPEHDSTLKAVSLSVKEPQQEAV